MRKKELIKLNEELFNRAEKAMGETEELRQENTSLRAEIAELKAKIEELSAKKESSPAMKVLEEKLISQVNLNEDTEYGAQIIGKIVVNATKYCNSITASMDSAAAKELVNLILGRTEVAKAEILKAVAAEMPIEAKKSMIDSEQAAAEDYFQSIMAQK